MSGLHPYPVRYPNLQLIWFAAADAVCCIVFAVAVCCILPIPQQLSDYPYYPISNRYKLQPVPSTVPYRYPYRVPYWCAYAQTDHTERQRNPISLSKLTQLKLTIRAQLRTAARARNSRAYLIRQRIPYPSPRDLRVSRPPHNRNRIARARADITVCANRNWRGNRLIIATVRHTAYRTATIRRLAAVAELLLLLLLLFDLPPCRMPPLLYLMPICWCRCCR